MRLLVFGGREFGQVMSDKPNWHTVYEQHVAMEEICRYALWIAGAEFWTGEFKLEIISGGAKGADRMGEIWAERNGYPPRRFPADWDKYGKRAGMLRNQQMLTEGKPDYALEFPGGRGTADMHQRLQRAGVQTRVVHYTPPSGRVSIWPRSDAWRRATKEPSTRNSPNC